MIRKINSGCLFTSVDLSVTVTVFSVTNKLKIYILIIKADSSFQKAVSWLRRSVDSLLPLRLSINPRPVNATFAVDKVDVRGFLAFLQVLQFYYFVVMLLVSRGQTGEVWEHSNKGILFRILDSVR